MSDVARTIVDAVVPVYGERSEAVAQTLRALVAQKPFGFRRIIVVDDGSPQPVRLPSGVDSSLVQLARLPSNRGISAARNAGLQISDAPFLACVNCEAVLDSQWLTQLLSAMHGNPQIGAAFGGIYPAQPHRLLSRWQMRFHEQPNPAEDGFAAFAPGHAVLFRRAAIVQVGGYDESLRRVGEDHDICQRMRSRRWEVWYSVGARAICIQRNSLRSLARKQLLRSGWDPSARGGNLAILRDNTRALLNRLGRNLIKLRVAFIPADVAIYLLGCYQQLMHLRRQER